VRIRDFFFKLIKKIIIPNFSHLTHFDLYILVDIFGSPQGLF